MLHFEVLALVVAQRLSELVTSRKNRSKMVEQGFRAVENPRIYLSMVLVHALWIVSTMFEGILMPTNLSAKLITLSAILLIFGEIVRLSVFIALREQWNTTIMTPNTGSKGADIVDSGPYKFVRHPNYLAVVIEFLTVPILLSAPITALLFSVLNGFVLYFRIQEEDRALFAREGYAEKMGRKPALIPRLPWDR